MYKLLITILLSTVSFSTQADVSVVRLSESGDSPRISSDGRFAAFVFDSDVFSKNLETNEIVQVDTNASGVPGNFVSGSFGVSISADGKRVAFSSQATNLVPDDNGQVDLFVKNTDTGEILRINEDAAGVSGNLGAGNPVISSNGLYVAFQSQSNNLIPGDTNGVEDVFVRNLETGEIVRASEDATGVPGNNSSFNPGISANGRFVSFHSEASNLVPGDTKTGTFGYDIYVKDLETGNIALVNESTDGVQGNGFTFESSSISSDGRFVAFESDANNLVPDDTNETVDVFVKNLETGEIVRASVDAAGNEGSGFDPVISADGRFVVFLSAAGNLVPGDFNNFTDVFLKNLETGEIERVNKGPEPWGNQANDVSFEADPSISADGRFVAFRSNATNLIVGESSGGLFIADVDGVNTPSAPGNIDYAIYSATAAEVFWDRVSNSGDYLYEIIRNDEIVGVLDVLSVFDNDLQPGFLYTYSVTPIHSSGNRLATATVSFTTGDTGPTTPENLQSQVYSDSAAEIFWNRSSDDGFVQGYEITRNGESLGVLDVLSVFEEGLNPALIYTYTVTAIDNEGNRSATATINLSTDDRQPPISGTPAALTGLRAAVYSATAAELFWDRPAIVGLSYEIQRDGEVVSKTNGVSYFDDTLEGGLSFQYEIVTIDPAGNRSAAVTITVSTE